MKILFIGNSHTYFNDMPYLFQQICERNEIKVHTTMLAHGGKGLDFHEKQEEVRFNILYGDYDYIILQHVAHPMGDVDIMFQSGITINKYIEQTKAKTVLYMTWTEQNNEAFQNEMSKAYVELGRRLGALVAPVGIAWWNLIHKNSDIDLYYSDGCHASKNGSLLAAYSIFSTIFNAESRTDNQVEKELSSAAYEALSDLV